MKCSADGTASTTEMACDASQVCAEGACQALPCTPGESTCIDIKTVAICKDDAGGFSTQPCGPNEACDNGVCLKKVCEISSTFCKGTVVAQCNNAGTDASNVTDCLSQQMACVSGTCVTPSLCVPGTTICKQINSGVCQSDGAGYEFTWCDDGNACTDGDTCANGACQIGKALNCNDNVTCTQDGCDPTSGCVHTTACEDDNPCTLDACDILDDKCVHVQVANGTTCSDGQACTVADACKNGECIGNFADCTKVICDPSCVWTGAGAGFADSLSANAASGGKFGADGSYSIDTGTKKLAFKYIWVANSGENSVSKVDLKTVKEVGRYAVCKDPAPTAVDLNGDAWIGCRGNNVAVKIAANKADCVDVNGDGIIQTAEDLNGDGNIQPNEMVMKNGASADECILFTTPSLGGSVRGLAVDSKKNIWATVWENKTLRYLQSSDATFLATVNLPDFATWLAIDGKGIVWVLGDTGLLQYNPKTQLQQNLFPPWGLAPAGLAIDTQGRVWVASSSGKSGASSYDPKLGQWVKCADVPMSKGIITASTGFVYAGLNCNGGVGKIDGAACWADPVNNVSYLGMSVTNGCPNAVAVDLDGFVWGINAIGYSVAKVDPMNWSAPPQIRAVGTAPDGYGDLTGTQALQFSASSASLSQILHLVVPADKVVDWVTVSLVATLPDQTSIDIRARAADSLANLGQATWLDTGTSLKSISQPIVLESKYFVGQFLEVELTLHSSLMGVSPAVLGISAQADVL